MDKYLLILRIIVTNPVTVSISIALLIVYLQEKKLLVKALKALERRVI